MYMNELEPKNESSASSPLEAPVRSPRTIRPVEAIAIAAVGVFIIAALFDVDIAVARRPTFERLFGGGQTASPIPPAVPTAAASATPTDADLTASVLPTAGIVIPVTWGDTGKRLADSGALDVEKFRELTTQRGGMPADVDAILNGTAREPVRMTEENASAFLNFLWALGLANENRILTEGPMSDPQYGGAGGFASTGGWPLAKGDAMAHYAKHRLIPLTPDQQTLVERVSKGIYRPCCGNSVYFPDCNHGMAMLGLLEIMAAQGVSEKEMYRVALQANAYWFPPTYLTLAKYYATQGTTWDRVDPKVVLGAEYSSSSGFQRILSQVEPPTSRGGGGCGA